MTEPFNFQRLTRRQFSVLMASSAGTTMFWRRSKAQKSTPEVKRPERLGTTFSQLQCSYMGLDYQTAFRQICSLGLDVIRLCSYWNEIEPAEGQFDFRTLDWLLEESQKHSVQLVLTVGMKAPRWPEYHFPDWIKARTNTGESNVPLDYQKYLAEKTLLFTQTVMERTRLLPQIKYWQVENEPLTSQEITAGRFLSRDFIEREVKLVRSLMRSDQKLLLTNAISLPFAQSFADERHLQDSLALADAVGINVYTRVPLSATYYLEPAAAYWKKLSQWQSSLVKAGREAWIAEAQAEPWEFQKLVTIDVPEVASTSPTRATELALKLASQGYSPVLLWGCEYWYWHQTQGRQDWWQAIQRLIAAQA